MTRIPHIRLVAVAVAVACAATACASEPYQPKIRNFEPGSYGPQTTPVSGSLTPLGGRSLLEDERAGAIGDVLIVRIDESDSASDNSSTHLDRASSQKYGFTGAFQAAIPDTDLSDLFGAEATSTFAGGGRIQRRGTLQATLPVRVKQRLTNGDLYVEGTKIVLIGNEQRHIYVSGIVRPIDIRADGSVLSSRIADAEIEYTGAGDASDQQRPGWLARVLTTLWPF